MYLGHQVLSFREAHCTYVIVPIWESPVSQQLEVNCTANTSPHVIQIITIADEIIKGKGIEYRITIPLIYAHMHANTA